MAYLKNPSVWSPLTLQGGGLFHLSMGAIVGFHVWGRTQEKIRSAELEFEASAITGPPILDNSMTPKPNEDIKKVE